MNPLFPKNPPVPKGIFHDKLLKDGDWFAEEYEEGARSFLTPDGELKDTILDGITEVTTGLYFAFDCLYFKGQDVRQLPLIRRRRYMTQAVETINNPMVAVVRNSALLGISTAQAIQTFERTVLKNLTSPYGVETSWVMVPK